MFETDKLFPAETVLSMEIYLPVDPTTIVSIFAKSKVVWVKEMSTTELHEGSNRYKIGTKFERIKKQDREKILALVQKTIADT